MDSKLLLWGELCNILDIGSKKKADMLNEILSKYQVLKNSNTLDFNEMVDMFCLYKSTENVDKNLALAYKKTLGEFGKFIRFKPINKVVKDDIVKYISNLETHIGTQSIYVIVSKLKNFFRWLEEDNFIQVSPCKSIRYKHLKQQRHYIPEGDVKKLQKACKTNFEHAIIELLLSSGLRCAEVCSITLKNVDFNECTAIVTGKGRKTRQIIFSEKAKKYILKYQKEVSDGEHLFCKYKTSAGKRLKSNKIVPISTCDVGWVVKTVAAKTDIKYSVYPHLFRHTFATQCLSKGMDLISIQKLLGHSNISTTQIYAESNLEQVKKEYKKVFKDEGTN